MAILSTLAFLFSSDLQKVLLIEKLKPAHHAGLLNGLGGKVDGEYEALWWQLDDAIEQNMPKETINHLEKRYQLATRIRNGLGKTIRSQPTKYRWLG